MSIFEDKELLKKELIEMSETPDLYETLYWQYGWELKVNDEKLKAIVVSCKYNKDMELFLNLHSLEEILLSPKLHKQLDKKLQAQQKRVNKIIERYKSAILNHAITR